MNVVLYVHGKGGNAKEAERYKPLFPDCDVVGLEYRGQTEFLAGREISATVNRLRERYEEIVLVANSIGAYYSMRAGIDKRIEKAFFISPIVDMEKLIGRLMAAENVTERELQEKGRIPTKFGEPLVWEYLVHVREHPVEWNAPTHILYGEKDELTDENTIRAFVNAHDATLTVMKGGEHWFHTDEQMKFLDEWLKNHR